MKRGNKKTISRAVFDRIESELQNYGSNLQEFDSLERMLIEVAKHDGEQPKFVASTRIVLHRRHRHLEDLLKSINQAATELTEEQREIISSIYKTANKEMTAEEERCRDGFINRIANLLGWGSLINYVESPNTKAI
ncbi:hypothetical protein DRW41_21975 [Neobacillus piezotolerans]|uniref:Uncharacterized protein n=1 Tax=Neobacillus piezotolerans TaxID=2259171 RepID=A0A3D8GKR1_9BACI|nr:hypothetical protein [Neobacillus piezotolerans]RDU34696.1 hypothetical protein DRW41_21975 [Neobacillus piezotolerans]